MTIRDEEVIRDKLNFYKEKGEAVHIKLVPTGWQLDRHNSFRNGTIQEVKRRSTVIDDEKLGEILIHLKEIRDVDKREVKK